MTVDTNTRASIIAAILFTCCLAFVAVSFSPYAFSIIQAWNTEEYSHGYIIPFVALLIAWHKLSEAKDNVAKPSAWGVVALVVSFALLFVANLSAFEPLAHYGFMFGIIGLLFSFLGVQIVRKLTVPLVYLIFCIPLPRLIEVMISAKLQLLSSNIGVQILQLMGFSVFQEGNIIDLGYHKLQVVEACSGLSYLFPLMSLSFLVAFYLKDRLWKKIVIFLSAIPITILMNSARIAWVGTLVNWQGPSMAEGTLHDLQGWSVFLVCLVVLLAEVWLITKIGKSKGSFNWEYLAIPEQKISMIAPKLNACLLFAVLACVAFGSLQLSGVIQDRKQTIPSHQSFSNFPSSIGDWNGTPSFLSLDILQTLKLTDYVTSSYSKSGTSTSVELYLAYYSKQGIGVSLHSPANCIPAGGWEIAEQGLVGLDVGGMTIQATRMRIEKGAQSMLVYYWFSQRGRVISDQYGAKAYLLIDSIMKNRSDGGLIRLTATVDKGQSIDKTDELIQEFAKASYPIIQEFIPQ